MTPNGRIFYQDEFDQLYRVEWRTVNGVIDITSEVCQPYVWGKESSGYIRDGVLFRRGIVTIARQVIRPFTGGYEIVADGYSQYEDDIQLNFPCQEKPVDNFKYHLDRPIVDEIESVVTDGPRWGTPEEDDVLWGEIDSNGDPVVITGTVLEFIDVWA